VIQEKEHPSHMRMATEEIRAKREQNTLKRNEQEQKQKTAKRKEN